MSLSIEALARASKKGGEKVRRVIFILFIIILLFHFYFDSPSSAQFINGDFSSGITGWETIGDVNTSNGAAVLETGGINGEYITSLSTDFIIFGDTLNFRFYFDITGPDDPKYPDFHSFPSDFFQMTLDAGDEGYFDETLAWNPTVGFVPFSFDISSITAGTMARLTFMLFDEDDVFRSVAGIDDVTDPSKHSQPLTEPGTLILLGGGLVAVFAYSRYRGVYRTWCCILILSITQILSSSIAYAELQETNVDDKTLLEFTSPVFNTRTNIMTLNMAITNISDTTIMSPLKIVITGISNSDVKVSNPDGYTPGGLPFFDMAAYISNQGLSAGEKSQAKKISFYNPGRIKFRWDQDVIAYVDIPVDTGPVIYNICLVPGEMPPVCEYDEDNFDVKNPEFQKLSQDILPEMYRYEQIRVYAFDYNDIPITVTINGIQADFNENWENGFYYFGDLTLKHGNNILSAVVTNNEGVSTSRDLSLNIDSVPPVINIMNVTDGAVVMLPDILINGSIDDPQITTIRMIRDFVTTEDMPVVNGVFSANIILSIGHNNLRFEAIDQAGNTGISNIDLIHVFSEFAGVSGRVYNSVLGVPVSGAVIRFTSGGGLTASLISGDAGEFNITGVDSGYITLFVSKDGYDTVNLNVFAAGGDTPSLHDIALIPSSGIDTLTLTGQVKDTGESPLSGVKISLTNTTLSAITDNNGIYIISGIPRTSFTAEASLDLYESKSININPEMYNPDAKILTTNVILRNIPVVIDIPPDQGNVPEVLIQLWHKFKESLIAGKNEDALLLIMPDTRQRYRDQLLLLGDKVPETFAVIGDIQLISYDDNTAKTRVYEGDITYYVWFTKDIFGQWKIHKF
ncbi:MAG: carboxypeptidase regulatory-like domain-containing protein [Nitrospirae bacterium]|nr:carboxypeptidase regulatory-like domain-containing protein [Nitrospirota bacterium]